MKNKIFSSQQLFVVKEFSLLKNVFTIEKSIFSHTVVFHSFCLQYIP